MPVVARGLACGQHDRGDTSARSSRVDHSSRGWRSPRGHSRATLRNIRQNLWLAFGYNALCLPIAAGALAPFSGAMLSPTLAALAMTFSSASVIANALRLRGARLADGARER